MTKCLINLLQYIFIRIKIAILTNIDDKQTLFVLVLDAIDINWNIYRSNFIRNCLHTISTSYVLYSVQSWFGIDWTYK